MFFHFEFNCDRLFLSSLSANLTRNDRFLFDMVENILIFTVSVNILKVKRILKTALSNIFSQTVFTPY